MLAQLAVALREKLPYAAALTQILNSSKRCTKPHLKYPVPYILKTMRKEPNIIITGTPGVGKTAHCEQLAQNTGLKHIGINKFAEEHDCYDGRDEELGSWIVDEDKVRLTLNISS